MASIDDELQREVVVARQYRELNKSLPFTPRETELLLRQKLMLTAYYKTKFDDLTDAKASKLVTIEGTESL